MRVRWRVRLGSPTGRYLLTKNWIANNLIGLCFSVQAIALINVTSWKIGATLLAGLFVYDIFWVFGTNVMVSVATKLSAPVKILFPKDLAADELQFALLGLGDIVVPGTVVAFAFHSYSCHFLTAGRMNGVFVFAGIFMALLLRFDWSLAKRPRHNSFSRAHFYAVFIGYILGLGATITVMHVFKAPQVRRCRSVVWSARMRMMG
jgi:minor histocompatibility antigen H13